MAMAVQQRRCVKRAERQAQAAGVGLPSQELLEQQRVRADSLCRVVLAEREQFVAQREQATRLEADDGYTARSEGPISCDQAIELGAGLVDQARGEECAAAAERAA